MSDLQVDVPPHVAETVRAIALLHAEHHRKSTLSERIVDRATTSVGHPGFLLVLIGGEALWILSNSLLFMNGLAAPDPPPFGWMELVLTGVALVIAVMILTSQRRADKFASLRE